MNINKKYVKDTAAYLNDDKRKRILFELYSNSLMVLQGVYIFKNLDSYIEQLQSDKYEDRGEEYWRASYSEKLIDYVKISIAFETFNKAVLLHAGYIIHKIRKNQDNESLHKSQKFGMPIKLSDFLLVSSEEWNYHKGYYLSGFNRNFSTIDYSLTLSDPYQRIINLNNDLCYHLKLINEKRNRLHFYTEFNGAFEVNSHIKKWSFIKEEAFKTLETRHKEFMDEY